MKQVDFRNGRILSNVLQSMLPMLVAQVLSLLYSIVDRIYIGRIPGEGLEKDRKPHLLFRAEEGLPVHRFS